MASEELENHLRRIVALSEAFLAHNRDFPPELTAAIQAIVPIDNQSLSVIRNNIDSHVFAPEAATVPGIAYTNNFLNNASNAANFAVDGAAVVSGQRNTSNATIQTAAAGSAGIINLSNRYSTTVTSSSSAQALAPLQCESGAAQTPGVFYMNNSLNTAANVANYAIGGSTQGNTCTTRETNAAASVGSVCWGDRYNITTTRGPVDQVFAPIQYESGAARPAGFVYASNSLNTNAQNVAGIAVQGNSRNIINQSDISLQHRPEAPVSARSAHVLAPPTRGSNSAGSAGPVCWGGRYNITTTRRSVDHVFAPIQYDSGAARPASFVYARNSLNTIAQNVDGIAVHGNSRNIINQSDVSMQHRPEAPVSAASAHALAPPPIRGTNSAGSAGPVCWGGRYNITTARRPVDHVFAPIQYDSGAARPAGFVYASNSLNTNAQNFARIATQGSPCNIINQSDISLQYRPEAPVSAVSAHALAPHQYEYGVAGTAGSVYRNNRTSNTPNFSNYGIGGFSGGASPGNSTNNSSIQPDIVSQNRHNVPGLASIGTNHAWAADFARQNNTLHVTVQTDAPSMNGTRAAASAEPGNLTNTAFTPQNECLNGGAPISSTADHADEVLSPLNAPNSFSFEASESTESIWRNNNDTDLQCNFRADVAPGSVHLGIYVDSSAINLQFGMGIRAPTDIISDTNVSNNSAVSSQNGSEASVSTGIGNWGSPSNHDTLSTIYSESESSSDDSNDYFNTTSYPAEHAFSLTTGGIAGPVNTSNSLSEHNVNILSQHYSEVESAAAVTNNSATSLQHASRAADATRPFNGEGNNIGTFSQNNFEANWSDISNTNNASIQYITGIGNSIGAGSSGVGNNNLTFLQNNFETNYIDSSNTNNSSLQYTSGTGQSSGGSVNRRYYNNNGASSSHHQYGNSGSTGPIRTSLQHTPEHPGTAGPPNWRPYALTNRTSSQHGSVVDPESTASVNSRNNGVSHVQHESDSRELQRRIYLREYASNYYNGLPSSLRICVNNLENTVNGQGSNNVAGNNHTRPVARTYNNLIQIIPSQTVHTQSVRDETRNGIIASAPSEMQPKNSEEGANESSSNAEISYKCSICFEAVQNRNPTSTECGHIFCRSCITRALRLYRKCPLCNGETDPSQLRRLYM